MEDQHFMGAVWHGARDVRVEPRSRMPLAPGEIRIRVAACGICGSDMHEYVDGPHAIPTEAVHPLSGRRAPLVIGHEFSGTVVELAPDVSTVCRGQRVVIEPEYRCGRCAACLRGEYNQCRFMGFAGLMGDGGMAEEAVVPAYMAHSLPDQVSFEQAAVLEPAAVALHAIRQGGLSAGMRCAVAGAGPIGLLIVQLARIAGARQIAVSDLSDDRLAFAVALGATHTVNAQTGRLAAAAGEVDVAFEAVGAQAALDDAYATVRKGGRLVLVGLFNHRATIDAFGLVNREINLISSVGYRHVFPDLIEMVASGLFDPSRIVTRQVSLKSVVEEGFGRLARETVDVKVLVRPCDNIG
ncbi:MULTISPECIES: 2,3-butanediol dehydrogenase [unclassified Bradyrhizobium]|uniref:2,3-butanediol dehydrogenase n=1 Tax=unclassified Bradyrhizobium TaxID=2631580 RepID=UPI001FF73623|nr:MULTISPECIES: 2,3-butanediol dehydrogenase [unclassified Bradyrhizobium]